MLERIRAPRDPQVTISNEETEITDKKNAAYPSYTKNIRIKGTAKILDEDQAKNKKGRIAIDVFNKTDFPKQYRKIWGESPTSWNKETGEWYYDKPAEPGKEYEFTVRASIGEAWAELEVKIEKEEEEVVAVEEKEEEKSDMPWMDIAKTQLGQTQIAGDQHNLRILQYHATTTLNAVDAKKDETFWCASFVSWCMEQAGINGARSASSGAWGAWKGGDKLTEPALGSIMWLDGSNMVIDGEEKNTGYGHVGFVVGKTSDGKIVLLGGNQSDMVRYSAYNPKNHQNLYKLKHYVLPKGYTPNYNVPTVTVAEDGMSITVIK